MSGHVCIRLPSCISACVTSICRSHPDLMTVGQPAPLVADDVYEVVMKNKERLNSAIIYDRDFEYDYFGFKTLEKSYLLKLNGKVRGHLGSNSLPQQQGPSRVGNRLALAQSPAAAQLSPVM
jgi:hypothetical protein